MIFKKNNRGNSQQIVETKKKEDFLIQIQAKQ